MKERSNLSGEYTIQTVDPVAWYWYEEAWLDTDSVVVMVMQRVMYRQVDLLGCLLPTELVTAQVLTEPVVLLCRTNVLTRFMCAVMNFNVL